EYQDLKKRLAEAEARAKTGEEAKRLAQIKHEKDAVQVKWFEADLGLRIQKSKIEEAWYEYEHAELIGEPTQGPKANLDQLLLEKDGIDKRVAEQESKRAQLEKEENEILSEQTALHGKIEEMEAEKTRLDQRLDGMVLVKLGPLDMPKIPKIEQVVIPEYEK